MEKLLSQFEAIPSHKDDLKVWCRLNDIKVSFLVSMTLSKSRTISEKLKKTYQKGFGKSKLRWLENELNLFHFILLVVSVLQSNKIQTFSQEQWQLLEQTFPSKDKRILQYQAKYFIAKDQILKKKWEPEEDSILAQIINDVDQDCLKWKEIAVRLFIESDKKYFRSTKQCRERWLNHLDNSINHEQWGIEEDKKLITNVIASGKKWSEIRRNFGNHRTEHMIKNRYISLIIKYRKNFPHLRDEDQIIKEISIQMNLLPTPEDIQRQRLEIEKKLRPRKLYEIDHHTEKISLGQNKQIKQEEFFHEQPAYHTSIPVSLPQSNQPGKHFDQNCLTYNILPTIPTPTFMSPLPFINCSSFSNNFSMFQYYMNYFPSDYKN